MKLANEGSLCADLEYVITMPDLCDVTFLVGPDCVPVYGIQAVIAARSSAFYQLVLARRQTPNKATEKSTVRKALSKFRKLYRGPKQPKDSGQTPKLTIDVPDFDPDTFRRLVKYIHSGMVRTDPSSVVGLLNAAHVFGLGDLRDACWRFSLTCIRPQTVGDIVRACKRYSEFEQTHRLMQEVLAQVQGCPDVVDYSPEVKRDLRENAHRCSL
ncbi:hypothetical protein ScPMuIL_003479 [Solemya velum]